MKKLLLITVAVAAGMATQAQVKYKVNATQGLGVHQNVFKAPPTLQTADGLQEGGQLYSNGVFSYTALDAQFDKKFNRKNDLRVNAEGARQQFLNLPNGSVHNADLDFRYRYKINKEWKLSMKGGVGNSNHLGINAFASESVLRFNYVKAWAQPQVVWKATETNTTRAWARVERRWYKPLPSGTDLSHRSLEWGVSSYQKLTEKDAITLKASTAKRNYFKWSEFSATANNTTEGNLEEAPEDEVGAVEEGARVGSPVVFRYYTGRATYKHKANETTWYKGFAQYQMRADRATGTWTYREFRVGASTETRYKNWGLAASTSVAWRHYPNRTAHMEDGSEPSLKYSYFNLTVEPKYYLNDQWEVFARVKLVNRFSNSTLRTVRARRGYNQSLAMVGIRWNIEGKTKQTRWTRK